MTNVIDEESFVTLHYRVGSEDGDILLDTFDMTPATLHMGTGQLTENLERCLMGLEEGDERRFLLSPEQGFGLHNPELVQNIARSALPMDLDLEEQTQISVQSDEGYSVTGFIRGLTSSHVLVDFNHPLAGQTVSFEVMIVGVL